jgi:hypothetical protein
MRLAATSSYPCICSIVHAIKRKSKLGQFGGFRYPLQNLISLTPELLRLPFYIRNDDIKPLG